MGKKKLSSGRRSTRSISNSAEVSHAKKPCRPNPFLAYALNGEPLTRHQGFPLRLLVPGWYGVANVKWLSEIHVQEEQYLGKYQARWYRTLKGEMIGGEMKWKETAITHLQLKSFVARVTRDGNRHKVFGVALNDGTPLKSVDVRVDDGPVAAGHHGPCLRAASIPGSCSPTIGTAPRRASTRSCSRAIDVNGQVQPTAEELEIEENVSRRQFAIPAESEDCLTLVIAMD